MDMSRKRKSEEKQGFSSSPNPLEAIFRGSEQPSLECWPTVGSKHLTIPFLPFAPHLPNSSTQGASCINHTTTLNPRDATESD